MAINLVYNGIQYDNVVELSHALEPLDAHLFAWFEDGQFVSMNAGALCYNTVPPKKGIITHCNDSNHNTVIEHTLFSFIKKVPIFVARQDMRSRVGVSYDERSLRYCRADDGTFQYYIPPVLKQPEHTTELEQWVEHHENAIRLYSQYTDSELLEGEQARALLPVGIMTTYVDTRNAWAWKAQLKKRLCLLAQHEIRMLYRKIDKQLKDVAPIYFSKINMPCLMEIGCHEKRKCGLVPLDFTGHWALSWLRSQSKVGDDSWQRELYEVSRDRPTNTEKLKK